MNYANLARAILARANTLDTEVTVGDDGADHVTKIDDAQLLRCLARMLSGQAVKTAFGAPGDWGYESPIGAALHQDYVAARVAGGQENRTN